MVAGWVRTIRTVVVTSTLLAIGWLPHLTRYAYAEGTANFLLQKYQNAMPEEREFIESKVADIEIGLSWANSSLQFKNEHQLYCPPAKLAPAGQQIWICFVEV